MKNPLTLLVGVLVVLVLLSYMFTFQVRYDEVAVVTTFDRADEPQYDDQGQMVNAGSLKTQPGFYLRWPLPVQTVYKQPTQLQVFDQQANELLTADGHAIVARVYVTWKVRDPYAFFRKTIQGASGTTEGATRRAETQVLRPLFSNIIGVIGRYRFDDMVNTDPARLKLEEIEKEALEQLRTRLDPSYGIELVHVGIRRILLPGEVTVKVFDRMRATRERLAADARATGAAQAAAIVSEANAARNTILAFADFRAQKIRSEGEAKAIEYYSLFQEDQGFAIFLRQLEALRTILSRNTTFILDAKDSLKPLELFAGGVGQEAPATQPRK